MCYLMTMIWIDKSKFSAKPPVTSCLVEHWECCIGECIPLVAQDAMKKQIVKMDQTAIKQVT